MVIHRSKAIYGLAFALAGCGGSEGSTGSTATGGSSTGHLESTGNTVGIVGTDAGTRTTEADSSPTGAASSDEGMATTTAGTSTGGPDFECVEPRGDVTRAVGIDAGGGHTCAILEGGTVRCWGLGANGQLGYGNTHSIGDDETPACAGDIDLGGVATQVAVGGIHTCALIDTGAVRCWGLGLQGQLGYGNQETIGDDETPAEAGDIEVGATVVQLAAGGVHTCALTDTGTVRCWGFGQYGRLGYGNQETIGDDETPASAGDVDVGGPVVQLAAGGSHTCAVLSTGAVRCWGFGNSGQLGYGGGDGYPDGVGIGDDETPSSIGDLDIGTATARLVTTGAGHTCIVADPCGPTPTGQPGLWPTVGPRCWGVDGAYQTGPFDQPNASCVPVSAVATSVDAGGDHTCALLEGGVVQCWGAGVYGQLGYGNQATVGWNGLLPSDAGNVNLGDPISPVTMVVTGDYHTCVLLQTGQVRCWGLGGGGRLGYGNTDNIGDDEVPADVGVVPLW